MWTISDKQMAAITESLVKIAEKITEKAINKGADAVSNIGKDSSKNDSQIVFNSQQASDSKIMNSKNNSSTESKGSQNITNSNPNTTQQTTDPILPCEQVEVVSLTSYKPTELPQKEILKKRWLTEDDVEITTSLTERNVKIAVETNGFFDGEKLKLKVRDSKNKVVKSLQVSLEGNRAITEVFKVEEEWLNKVLFITFES